MCQGKGFALEFTNCFYLFNRVIGAFGYKAEPAFDEIPRYLRNSCIVYVIVLEKKLDEGAKFSYIDQSRVGVGVFFPHLLVCLTYSILHIASASLEIGKLIQWSLHRSQPHRI